jgi:polysaccharide export outer membrane protein
MQTQIEALNQAKVLATNQVEALNSKAISLSKQIDLANKDLGTVNKLVSQGLTLSSRQLGANQYLTDLESRNLDVSLAILKTQQDLAKVDQDIADLRDRYRVNALTESAELRDRLASNVEKTKTAQALLRNIEARAPAAVAVIQEDDEPAFITRIDRIVDGSIRTVMAADNDPVAPGDVIRVVKRDRATALSAADSTKPYSSSP